MTKGLSLEPGKVLVFNLETTRMNSQSDNAFKKDDLR